MNKTYFVVESVSHPEVGEWDDEVKLEIITIETDGRTDYVEEINRLVPTNTDWWLCSNSQAARAKITSRRKVWEEITSRVVKIIIV